MELSPSSTPHPSSGSYLGQLWFFAMSCLRDPLASPELGVKNRSAQFRAVMDQMGLAGASSLLVQACALTYFWGQGSPWLKTVLFVIHGSLQVFNVGLWLHWRKLPRHLEVSGYLIWMLSINVIFGALLWSVWTGYFISIGDPVQRVLVVAVVAGLIATGGWMLAVLPHTGIAWTLSLSFGAIASLAFFTGTLYSSLMSLLAGYGVILLGTVLVTSKQFLERLAMSHASDHQHQLVGLLLNDFEENASDWLWETDAQGRLRHVSVRFANILDREPHQLQGQLLQDLLEENPLMLSSEKSPGRQALSRLFQADQAFRGLVVPAMVLGARAWWSLSAKPLLDELGTLVGWRGVGSDVTQLKLRELELVRLANVDSLTGLANRHQFNLVLSTYFVSPLAEPGCTLFTFDLDNFKSVNDSLGHSAGDMLLRELGSRLFANAPSQSLIARLGGDEFALIVPGLLGRSQAQSLGDQFQAHLNKVCVIQGHRIEAQASFGVACAPRDAANAQDLVKRADMALYAAKSAGRRTLRFFEPEMDRSVRRRLSLLADLREGLRLGQFELHYQPQIDWGRSSLVGFEALVRWRHPTRGMISPAEFIPLAEDSGLIVALGQWVQLQACRDAATWPAHLSVAVNVSAIEFERSEVLASIASALDLSGLPASRLEIELTESTLLQDSAATLSLLGKLRETGVRVALDDFGTGFSSLSYLRSFPLDKLKIDRSFVQKLDADDEKNSAYAIVQAIHTLSSALGLQTIAEGVETIAQLKVLQKLGCNLGQGFLYSKPLDLIATLSYIERYSVAHPKFAVPSLEPQDRRGQGVAFERPSPDLLRDARRIAAGRASGSDANLEAIRRGVSSEEALP